MPLYKSYGFAGHTGARLGTTRGVCFRGFACLKMKRRLWLSEPPLCWRNDFSGCDQSRNGQRIRPTPDISAPGKPDIPVLPWACLLWACRTGRRVTGTIDHGRVSFYVSAKNCVPSHIPLVSV